jgi:hypothetical protein
MVVPEFDWSAPPTVPGIPIQNSTPDKPEFAAFFAKAGNITPDPVVILIPLTSMLEQAIFRDITNPSTPPSAIRIFDPAPIIRTDIFLERAHLIRS